MIANSLAVMSGDAKETVLIVDDTPENIDVLVGVLSSDYRSLVALSGERALAICSGERRPDLILLDIRMPDPDGYKTAQRLKGEPKTENIPIAFFTNEDLTPEAEKMVKNAWVADYIHKSIDLDDFVKRIKKILHDFKKS